MKSQRYHGNLVKFQSLTGCLCLLDLVRFLSSPKEWYVSIPDGLPLSFRPFCVLLHCIILLFQSLTGCLCLLDCCPCSIACEATLCNTLREALFWEVFSLQKRLCVGGFLLSNGFQSQARGHAQKCHHCASRSIALLSF